MKHCWHTVKEDYGMQREKCCWCGSYKTEFEQDPAHGRRVAVYRHASAAGVCPARKEEK